MIGRGQHWSNCDRDVREFVLRVVDDVRWHVGEQTAGIYLHGSLAHGCYRRAKSDVDVLVVTAAALSPESRRELSRACVALSDARPTIGDLELTALQRYDEFVHPLPYEAHFGSNLRDAIASDAVDYAIDRRDPDLAAHCTVARACGVALFGPPCRNVLAPVPWSAFVAAVLDDFEWIVTGDHILESPFYAVLNACRVLQLSALGEGTIASKQDGARWALATLPAEYRAIVRRALDAYCSDAPVTESERKTAGVTWDAAALRRFRDFAAAAIRDRA